MKLQINGLYMCGRSKKKQLNKFGKFGFEIGSNLGSKVTEKDKKKGGQNVSRALDLLERVAWWYHTLLKETVRETLEVEPIY
jgi:hypothetical protein